MFLLLFAIAFGLVHADEVVCSTFTKKKFCNAEELCEWDSESKTCLTTDTCHISNVNKTPGKETKKRECITSPDKEDCFWVSGPDKRCVLKEGLACAGLNKHSCMRLEGCEWSRDPRECRDAF